MKYKLGKKEISGILGIFLLVIASMLAYYVIFKGGNIIAAVKGLLSSLKSILWGVLIAYVMLPVLNSIEKKILIPLTIKAGKRLDGSEGIKRRKKITSTVETEVQEKIQKLRIPSSKSVRSVLVYDGDLAPEVVEDAYFGYLIPVERLFGR